MKTVTKQIHALSTMPVGFSGDQLPMRIRVANWGDNPNVKGIPFKVSEWTKTVLAMNQDKVGFGLVALDYEHNTLPSSEEFKRTKEPRDVAAFGTLDVVDGQGIDFVVKEWTPSGREHARNYPDVSPAASLIDGEIDFVHSVALTRNGAIYNLPSGLVAASIELEIKQEENGNMWEKIAKVLGCEPTEESCMAALAAKMALVKDLEDKVKGVEGMSAKLVDIEKLVTAHTALIDGHKASIEAMSATSAAEGVKAQKDAIIAAGRKEGKKIVLTDKAIEAMSVEDVKAHVEAMPKIVAMSAAQPAATQTQPKGLSATQQEIARQFNFDTAKAKEVFGIKD